MNEGHVKSDKPDEALLTRYLLGELPEHECSRIEQDCLADSRIFDQLEAIEAELTDDYVRGVLRGQRRRQFEKRVLAHAPRPQLQLAELITGCARPQASFLLRVSALAAAVLLAMGMGWFLLRHSSPKPAQPQVARNTQPVPPPQPTPTQTAPPKTPVIATFVLIPGGVRGDGEANEIRVPSGASQVRFRIDRPANEYRSYDASLNRVEGAGLLVRRNIKPRRTATGITLLIDVPAKVVPVGASVLTLTGAGKTVAKYVITRRGKE
jgi:anti-sigma factor RsiW